MHKLMSKAQSYDDILAAAENPQEFLQRHNNGDFDAAKNNTTVTSDKDNPDVWLTRGRAPSFNTPYRHFVKVENRNQSGRKSPLLDYSRPGQPVVLKPKYPAPVPDHLRVQTSTISEEDNEDPMDDGDYLTHSVTSSIIRHKSIDTIPEED